MSQSRSHPNFADSLLPCNGQGMTSRSVERISADANVRPLRILIGLVRQRMRRKTVAIDDQAVHFAGKHLVYRRG
jgi:hypothetical protein